jgi:ABC-type antimicrobial peptide transport system permease subunit
MAAIGAGIGVAVAYLAGRVVSSRLYEVSASDPIILAGASALVVFITLFATVIPAWRAARLNPARALWSE